KPSVSLLGHHRCHIEADSVIDDGTTNHLGFAPQLNSYPGGAGVSAGVGQGLLNYTVESRFNWRWQAFILQAFHADLQSGSLRDSLAQELQRRQESKIVEHHRAKFVGELAQ